jgi:FkbM family methyltransferase
MPTDTVKDYTVSYTNEKEFKGLVREIFMRNTYFVELNKENPTIVDIGAHIGLTTLYYKKLFPQSTVIAVEPHPANIKLLKQNVAQNLLTNVHIIEGAVAESTGEINLYADETQDQWFSTSRIKPHAWDGTKQTQAIQVPAVSLDDLITTPVDIVKMDIEGAEEGVLKASKTALNFVDHLLIEYHPGDHNNLPEIFNLLKEAGYYLQIFKNGFGISLKRARGLVMIEARK